tara:strand:- start:167 stop:1078 length:912 start_codon:yes stop_codon:yes gene_type:complete
MVILANDPHRRIEMPALRYFVHLNAPGWNVMGGGEPPFVGVDAGHNERMAWGFTFAGTDMVDMYVEEVNPQDENLVRWQDGWEPLEIIEEEIRIKGEATRTVQLKFSRHGPVVYEDRDNNVAYVVRSVVQEPGTAAYKGSFKMAQAESCEDFFERAMYWMIPTHSLICGDVLGNIALQVTGLTPDRDGWNGRLPVPGNGQYEWQGFREDLPREFNPERGYITTANNNVHPPATTGGRSSITHLAVWRLLASPVCIRSWARTSGSRWRIIRLSSTTPTRCEPNATSPRFRAGPPNIPRWNVPAQ